jgi:serine protease Do
MKLILTHVIPLAGLALTLPALHAAEESAPQKQLRQEVRVMAAPSIASSPAPGGTFERRIRVVGPQAGEMETVTFLGVQAEPVNPTLTEQLGLAPDTGLVVAEVVPESPAAAVLKAHDILLKFNDQLLIDQRQFTVLVRNSKEGDEVTLTYLRAGQKATTKVKLGTKDLPKGLAFDMGGALPGAGAFAWSGAVPMGVPSMPAARADVDHVLGLIDLGKGGQPQVVRHNQLGGDRMIAVTVNTGDSNMSYSDDQGSLELTIKEGKKELVAKDPKGETIFTGPINTPEERKALPDGVAARLEKIETMQGFTFKTDEAFEGGEVRVMHPLGHGIALPDAPERKQSPRLRAL